MIDLARLRELTVRAHRDRFDGGAYDEFVAAVKDTATVLALLDRIEEAERRATEWKKLWESCDKMRDEKMFGETMREDG